KTGWALDEHLATEPQLRHTCQTRASLSDAVLTRVSPRPTPRLDAGRASRHGRPMRALLALFALACAAAPVHPNPSGASSQKEVQPTPLDEATDLAFLRRVAETRSFSLGRPRNARPTPDGRLVLFLRSEARRPVNHLFAFDVASGQTRELA